MSRRGVVADGTAPQLLGCEAIPTNTDTVGVVSIGPLRADYPAGHPCATRAP